MFLLNESLWLLKDVFAQGDAVALLRCICSMKCCDSLKMWFLQEMLWLFKDVVAQGDVVAL